MQTIKNKIEKELLEYIISSYENKKLPKLYVTEKEWNAFFDTIYTKLIEKNIVDSYDTLLHVVVIRALNIALFETEKFLTLNTLLEGINDIQCFGFNTFEIKELKEEIRKKADYGKVIYYKR